VVAGKADDGREVEPAFEPRFYLMDAPALHLQRMLAVENTQVIVDRLALELCRRRRPRAPGLQDTAETEPDHERGRGGHGERGPAQKRGLGRLGGAELLAQPPLEIVWRGVTRQPRLERIAERPIGRRLVPAGRAAAQVRLDLFALGALELAA